MSNTRSRWHAYGRVPKELLRDPQLSATAKTVAAMMDEAAGHEDVTHETLAEWLGVSVATARRAVYELRDAGWLTVEEQHQAGRQLPNLYTVHEYREGSQIHDPGCSPMSTLGGAGVSTHIRDDETKSSTSSKRGSRMTDEWEPDDELKSWARERFPGVSLQVEVERFRDYWLGVSGAAGVKLDWRATFRNWIRNQDRYRQERTAPRATPTSSPAADARRQTHVDWLREQEEEDARFRAFLSSKNLTARDWLKLSDDERAALLKERDQ